MPDNHIYFMARDHLGYLWMATPNGVVRYNGYETKVFNLSNGLPTADVWGLLEDVKGRIWLEDHSGEHGYIYLNQYHKLTIPKDTISFFSENSEKYKNGTIFLSWEFPPRGPVSVYIADGDSLHTVGTKLTDTLCGISAGGALYLSTKNKLYKGNLTPAGLTMQYLFPIDSPLCLNANTGRILTNHLFFYLRQADFFWEMDMRTGKKKIINTSDYLGHSEPINLFNIIGEENHIDFITQHHILQFTDGADAKLTGLYDIGVLCGDKINGANVTAFLNDPLWGNCIATNNNGLILNFNIKNALFCKSDINLKKYKYAGNISEKTAYWWNRTDQNIGIVTNGQHIKIQKCMSTGELCYSLPYKNDSVLLFFNVEGDSYWYTSHNSKLTKTNGQNFGMDIRSAVLYDNDIFLASKSGLFKIKLNDNKDNKYCYDRDRYESIVFDSLRKMLWAYSNYKIFIHTDKKDTVISKSALATVGVAQLEKIIVDNKYGNVFLKSNEKLIMYNYEKRTYKQLFSNYNFIGAVADIYNNTLIVSGKFGVLFSKIENIDQISAPVVYNNIKSNYYNSITGMQLSDGMVLLNTDKDTYKISIPSDSVIINNTQAPAEKYKLIVNYMDTAIGILSGDTININQDHPVLAFDFINPIGNGNIRYSYCLSGADTSWHELNGSALTLPQLSASRYITLGVIAYDNIFRSNKTIIYLYIHPFWWQTFYGRCIIIFMVLLLFASSVFITRSIVISQQQKRNLRMQLELKAIYAQINPHFIFNTLNSVMLMVKRNKMDEAYEHIYRFSRLLRGYLKSSRNKLTSIDEEINNLEDYIELQQTRFKDKFDYELVVGDSVDRNILIPALLIQPFVENAINHGILPKKEKGRLKIEFSMSKAKNQITCIIEDDGIGQKQSRLRAHRSEKEQSDSYGDAMIKDLVNIFKKYESMDIEIGYTDKEGEDTGTIVTIHIKNLRHA